ncbi:TlpA family protein disulfide reductase [Candidatus Aminicenantes bacterium AH-873-B07]|nr:TlpA family protein disulfide reductase [Candidatus Aminicenantes bacterium AH-873-B07]
MKNVHFKKEIQKEKKVELSNTTLDSMKGRVFIDFTLEDLSGKIIKLHDIKALFKVIIIFSPLDCPRCLYEYPLWKKIDESYPDNIITIIGIARTANREELISFVKKKNFSFPILYDPHDKVREEMGLRFSPLRILLDQKNRIIKITRPNAELIKQKITLVNLDSIVRECLISKK